MLIIGLTGGICSGKSTVAALFSELDTPVFDADIVARELVEPGQPALQEIISLFGSEVLDDDGRLDRAILRNRIFSQTEDRKQLEHILHPRIREHMTQQGPLVHSGNPAVDRNGAVTGRGSSAGC